jgi:outer membrane protein TolC
VRRGFCLRAALPFVLLAVSGCADLMNDRASSVHAPPPSVAPATQPTASLKVDASQIKPMYDRRMLAVDLPTVIRIAMSRNIDIQEAQQRIAASQGEFEANVGMIFPSLTPNVTAIWHPRGGLHTRRPSRSGLQSRHSAGGAPMGY